MESEAESEAGKMIDNKGPGGGGTKKTKRRPKKGEGPRWMFKQYMPDRELEEHMQWKRKEEDSLERDPPDSEFAGEGGGKNKGKGSSLKKGKGLRRKEERLKREREQYMEWKRKQEEELERNPPDPESWEDPLAYEARSFKNYWTQIYGCFGDFDENTSALCILPRGSGVKLDNLQIYAVEVCQLTGGLQWPLDVFGMVAVRDTLDHRRNIIFERKRCDCQTLTSQHPFLVLTGPVRAVLLCSAVVFEVSLYVRGSTESEDKELNLLAVTFRKSCSPLSSLSFSRSYKSRLSTLRFMLGHIVYSVEARIKIKVISAPPDGFRGNFVAETSNGSILLLDSESQDNEPCLAGHWINLTRFVASVEFRSKLEITVYARPAAAMVEPDHNSMGNQFVGRLYFEPQEKGETKEELRLGLARLEVTVAWSLFSFLD
ncbi:hypothetical protein ACP4OV_003435 [Aristida adscensionis]